jgi:hypothetical protein
MPRGSCCERYSIGESPPCYLHNTTQHHSAGREARRNRVGGACFPENARGIMEDDKKPSVGCCSIQARRLPEAAGQARQTRQSRDRE